MPDPATIDIAHTVQVALTPVFLVSGIGTLLNVFNTRLARVSDHAEHINELLQTMENDAERSRMERQLARLHRRTAALDLSVAFGAVAAAITCMFTLALFVLTARDRAGGTALLLLFGAALLCTVCAIIAFVADSILSWHGLRTEGPMPSPRRGLVKLVR